MNPGDAQAQSIRIPGLPAPVRVDFLAAVILAAVATALYLPMLGGDFVYDGRMTVYANDYIHHLRNLVDVLTLRIMHMDVMDNNRPVYVATAMIDWAVWGANPAGHHFVNIVLHAGVTLLIFRLCRILRDDACVWIPFSAALLYAVHPLNSEAVAEISYRKDLLAAFFVLAALNLATEFRPMWSRRNMLIGAACVASLFLSVGAKENGVAGPPVLICYWLLFRRTEPHKGWIVLCSAALLAVGLFLTARFTLPPAHSIIFTQKPQYLAGSLADANFLQPRILACYLRNIVWPRGLTGDYGLYSIHNFKYIWCMLAVVAVVAAQIFLAVYNRQFALGVAIFWLALLPVANFMPIYRPMADRFLYFPMAGVAVMLATIPWRWPDFSKAGMAVAILLSIPLACVTFQREKVWHDSLALWSDSASRNPFSPDSYAGFGGALHEKGRYKESVAAFERAIKLSGGKSADQFACMALSLDALGRRAEADAAFKKAVSIDERYAHPDMLLKALIWEKTETARLQVIASRN